MDYSQRDPGKNISGIAMVVILHLAIGYALVTGLARKVVEVIKAPIETKIIEEVKTPPPDVPPPPPPKMAAPPPPFIPPPEINIQVPKVTPPPTITTVTTTKPPAGSAAGDRAARPGRAPPAPLVRKEYKAAYRVDPVFPRQAQRDGTQRKAWSRACTSPPAAT